MTGATCRARNYGHGFWKTWFNLYMYLGDHEFSWAFRFQILDRSFNVNCFSLLGSYRVCDVNFARWNLVMVCKDPNAQNNVAKKLIVISNQLIMSFSHMNSEVWSNTCLKIADLIISCRWVSFDFDPNAANNHTNKFLISKLVGICH